MAISSMTAFTRIERKSENIAFSVEIKSLNNKFLDVKTSLPNMYSCFQNNIVKLFNQSFSRGSFLVNVKRDVINEDYLTLEYNKVQVDKFVALFRDLKKSYNIKDDFLISDLILSSAISFDSRLSDDDLKNEWIFLDSILRSAIVSIKNMRKDEGAYLWKDINCRLGLINGFVKQIEEKYPISQKGYQQRLENRLNKTLLNLMIEHKIDKNDPRFFQEVGYLSERSDITEELTRLKAHVEEFYKFENCDVIGRKMDFLLQELNREINTIGSKCIDTEVALLVVEIKSEIEKIRQQVQNIE